MMKVCFKTETLMLQITAADLTASAAQLITNDKTTKGEKYLKKKKKQLAPFNVYTIYSSSCIIWRHWIS